MQVRVFNWLPNMNEAHSKIRYDFIELPLLYFYNTALPSELNFNKMDANSEWLAKATNVDMPIIHFEARRAPENRLNFFQGRHRTYPLRYILTPIQKSS